jgi:ABC-type transport system substrate-binding protein
MDGRARGVTRRALLGSGAVGAAGIAAGCSGDGGGDGDGTPTETPVTETEQADTDTTPTSTTSGPLADVDSTLHYFMAQNPEDVTWFGTGPFPGPQGRFLPSNRSVPKQLTMQNSIRGPWLNNPIKSGEFYPETYESVDVTPDEITVKIRDDANWSNGDPITSGDALSIHLVFRLLFAEPHWDDVSDSPPIFNRLVTDYEIVSDKEFTFRSQYELWDQFTEQAIWADMCWVPYAGGVWQKVDQEPYDEWWAAIQDWWSMAKEGEISPWEGEWNVLNETKAVVFGDYGWEPGGGSYDHHWEKHFRDPTNVHTTGAWTLDAINGTKNVELVPNEHHYRADEVNFPRIRVHFRESDRANRAAVNANGQDYYRGDVPQHIAESFPDDFEQRLVPASGGLGVAFNHRHPLFERRLARKAMQFAIDTERLAQSVHQTKYDAVSVPGGHGYRTAEVTSQEWIDDELERYERDIERASQLMSEAGFSREGGQWVDEDGSPLSVSFATPKQTPTLEPTFASQLRSFGVDASIQSYSEANFAERKDNGDLDMWPTQLGVGYASDVGQIWYMLGRYEERARNWFRVYPTEQIDAIEWAPNGDIATNRPPSWSPFTIEAPPVGEPDGELQEYQTSSISMRVRFPSSVEQFREDLKKATWVLNWHMPVFPIANARAQHFLDTAHWLWPDQDSSEWNGVGIAQYQPENLVAFGHSPQGNPENAQ